MKTLIDIDDDLLERARQLIGPNTTKRDAVNAALSRFVRLHAQREAVDWIAEVDPVAELRPGRQGCSSAVTRYLVDNSVCSGSRAALRSAQQSRSYWTTRTSYVAAL